MGFLGVPVAVSGQRHEHHGEHAEYVGLDSAKQQLEELKNGPDPVFLDFTAAWCLTCKANELVVFRSDEVKKVFREKGIVGMKGDWTTRNPEITRALAQFGRTGVPLYVYFAGDGAAPVLLPEILNPGIVLDVIRGGN